ncbi:MAG: dynamin family protein [Thermoanaerobacterales bacterium]|nr:dynamin family protein [Thermoanaerobacterales bacterium]
MSNGYAGHKAALQGALDELIAIVAEKGNRFAGDLLNESAARLRQETITLVVLGEFKRGKSTFINALLGDNVLPTAIVPLTAIPTIIRHGAQTGATVFYLDGREETIPVPDIPSFVTERGNPGNKKGVREVVLTHPSPYLARGVILVDTPGVGSVYEHNTEAAYGYLPRADAGVFIVSVDAPLGKTELSYLHDIRRYVGKMVFILNKADLAQGADLDEAFRFVRDTLREHLEVPEITLLPISAKQALEGKLTGDEALYRQSRMPELEGLLRAVAEKEKASLILSATASRAQRVINELTLGLELWRRGMDESLESLQEKMDAFTAELGVLEQEREDSIYLLYREVEKLGAWVGEEIENFKKKIQPELTARLEAYLAEVWPRSSVKEVAEKAKEFTKKIVLEALEAEQEQLREKIKNDFEAVAKRFFARIEAIVDRMMSVSAEIFNVPVHRTEYKEYILGDRYFYFHFWEHPTFIPAFEDLTVVSMLPKALLRKKVTDKARDKLAELLDRNCGRVRADLVTGLTERVREVAGELRLRADAVAFGLKGAVERAMADRQAGAEERAKALVKCEAELERLGRLRKTVEAVLGAF